MIRTIRRAGLLALLCVLSAGYAAEPELILHWTFDHGTSRGEPDVSGHGRHALLAGHPPHHPFTSREPGLGVLRGAAQIKRRSLIKSVEPVPLGESWTLCFWVRQTSTEPSFALVQIPGVKLDLTGKGDGFRLQLEGMPDLKTDRPRLAQWEHVAVAVAPGRARFFLDGKQVDQWDKPAWRFPQEKGQLVFGAADWHRLFYGYFDEIRLYRGELTPEAVARLADPKAYAAMNYPPRVDPGPAVTLWQPDRKATLTAAVDDDGKAPLSHTWRVRSAPEGATPAIADPAALETTVTLPEVGHYELELVVTDGPCKVRERLNAVVFPPRTPRPGKPYDGPHHMPELGYTPEFIKKYFPPLPKTPIQERGFAKDRFSPPPEPGIHPRIFFGPDDLPELRRRLRATDAGRKRMQRLRDALGHLPWLRGPYELPDDLRNQVVQLPEAEAVPHGPAPRVEAAGPLLGEVPVPDLALPDMPAPEKPEEGEGGQVLDFYRPFTRFDGKNGSSDHTQAGQMVNEAFRCLIDADSDGARRVIGVLTNSAEAQIRWLEKDEIRAQWNWQNKAHDIVGRFADALIYDFLHPWMTEQERALVRRAIALAVDGRWAIGMYGMRAGNVATGNWSAWLTGDLMINALAIEGEDGFDPKVYEACVEMWRQYLTFGYFPHSGAPFEGIGKGLMSAEKLAPITRRGEPLLASQTACRFASRWLLQTMVPYGGKFIRDDLHGGIGRAVTGDICAVKHAFPDDPVIDFVYRNAMGETYPGGPLRTTYSAAIALAPLFMLDDWKGPADWQEHLDLVNKAAGGLPLSYFARDTGVVVTRSAWRRDALHLYFRPRRLGGHRAPNRGTFVVSALGRTWNHHSTMGERAGSQGYSLVIVDGETNSADDARVVGYRTSHLATFAAADLQRTYARGGPGDITWNDTLLTPLRAPWADLPRYKLPQWYEGRRPAVPMDQWDKLEKGGPAPPRRRQAIRPFRKAFRTAGMVRGKHSYVLVVDDIRQDDQPRHYDWLFRMAADVRVFKVEPIHFRSVKMPGHGDYWLPPRPQGGDIILCDENVGDHPPKGTPMLLVRVLERRDQHPLNPLAYVQDDPAVIHGARRAPSLVVPAWSAAPHFKVMIYPFRHGLDPLPRAAWNEKGDALTLQWPDQHDTFRFSTLKDGRTGFEMERIGVGLAPGERAFNFGSAGVESMLKEIEKQERRDGPVLPDF
jgi:hypothetical protein